MSDGKSDLQTTSKADETEAADPIAANNAIEPIEPHLARQQIEAAIEARLGPNWQDDDTGWAIIHDTDYLVRLTRGRVNMDFHCDLLGEVTVTERDLNPVQDSGRILAWAILLASLTLALVLARLAGVLG